MRTHFPDLVARQRLAERFGLPWNPAMQDWEVEVADPERLEEFAAAWKLVEGEAERLCLFELVLATLDELLVDQGSPSVSGSVLHVLRSGGRAFPDVLEWWQQAGLAVSGFLSSALG